MSVHDDSPRRGSRRGSALARLAAAFALLSLWLLVLFVGGAPAPLTHLLLLAALACFPWRVLRADRGGRGHE